MREQQSGLFVPEGSGRLIVGGNAACMGGSPLRGRQEQQGWHAEAMTNEKASKPVRPAAAKEGKRTRPEWADGLRQLYDSVLNEPLPDSFADLIAKLDDDGK
jgi:hypothetical protein